LSRPNRFESDLDKVWRHWFAPFEVFEAPSLASPSVDLAETESEVIVKAELPGLTDKDIDITLSDDTLTIQGEKKQDSEEKGKHYHRVERRYGSFKRCVTLPSPVDAKGVAARFENGVLEITLPKAEEAKPKKIEIN
jgi:HSP20 family protein